MFENDGGSMLYLVDMVDIGEKPMGAVLCTNYGCFMLSFSVFSSVGDCWSH